MNIDHQLQRLSDMTLVIEPTKTSAGTRKLPITEDVAKCFQAIIEDREKPKVEKVVDGYTGFLFLDDEGLPLVAMYWEHRFNHMVKRYNDIYRVQMPNCQTAHCGRYIPHFDFSAKPSPIVPYRHLPQSLSGMTADCRSLV